MTTDPTTQAALTFEQARRRRRPQRTTDAHAIFAAPPRAEAAQRLATFQARWGDGEPEVVRKLAQGSATRCTL